MVIKGMLTRESLQKRINDEEIETVVVGFSDHYGRLMGKRFDAAFFMESVADHGTHACNYLLTTDMEMEPLAGFELANWELGYGDFHLVPDFSTLRQADWQEKTALIICDVKDDQSHQFIEEAPRSILRSQVERASGLGYKSFAASELEYYLFKEGFEEASNGNMQNLTPAGYYLEDYHILQGTRNEHFTGRARKHLKNSGIPVENSKGEWGLGQHELNVQYAETLDMADRHTVYKQCLKELADQLGLSVTFMAKYKTERAGSSCHIHMSLWKDDTNQFVGDETFGPLKCSAVFRWFLGGWIKYVPDVMPFYAPTINSYKRYVDQSWAPTRLAWSYDNRTAGFRVVGKGNSLRIECRIPGADCNPYLAFAASLASGLQGLEEKIEPPECFTGDIYAAAHLPRVPYTLESAVKKFENSDFVKNVFGENVLKHYSHFYRKEIEDFNKSVTDWEQRRYFERI